MSFQSPPEVRSLGLGDRPLILASSSPRRIALLASCGIPFHSAPVSVDESIAEDEDAETACLRLAHEKAKAAAVKVPDAWVLGADTLVVLEGRPLGKPKHEAEARDMLRRLSGRSHDVWTGLALYRALDGALFDAAERTRVWFDELSDDTVFMLARAEESLDKAGGYGIQGRAAPWISRIEGDYYNVVGLPLARLRRLLQEASRWKGTA
ncbi:MAG TPA: nucleoside triphosphate pyrophosphatase [Candidatus Eisenbacteria bacterium]|nr:nucleoside triphosphate pyrophosphatase [Candidatus Eisenbacteria bacterium]